MRKDSAAVHRDARQARARAIASFFVKLFKPGKKEPRHASGAHLARQG
jgi:hypothetical protein